jgi:hypothetical protein
VEQLTCTTSPLRSEPACFEPALGVWRTATGQSRPAHVEWTAKGAGADGGALAGAEVDAGASVVVVAADPVVELSLRGVVAARELELAPSSRPMSATTPTAPPATRSTTIAAVIAAPIATRLRDRPADASVANAGDSSGA